LLMATVIANDVHKAYGDTHALRGISFEVRSEEVFALLGPNGAGKTTTVEILEGYRRPDRGGVRVLGLDPFGSGAGFRDRIGIMLQQSGIERELTVKESLERLARFYTRRRDATAVISMVGLDSKADARIKTLSGGQRRRLDLAAALIGTPEVLFLDEPTTGFDPEARRVAWDMIRQLEGATVILTTHYLDEAQALADRVAVISGGRIVAEGEPSTLGGRDTGVVTIRFRRPDSPLPPEWSYSVEDGWVEISSTDPTRDLWRLTDWAIDLGVSLQGLEVLRPTLEDTYFGVIRSRRSSHLHSR